MTIEPVKEEHKEELFQMHELCFREHIDQIWGWDDVWQREYFDKEWQGGEWRVMVEKRSDYWLLDVEAEMRSLVFA